MNSVVTASEDVLWKISIGMFDLSKTDIVKNILEEPTDEYNKHELIHNGASTHLLSSDNDLLKRNSLVRARETIQNCVTSYAEKLSIGVPQITNSWINVMGHGGFVHPHVHNNSIISGALYLNIDNNSSKLYFISPLSSLSQKMIMCKTDNSNIPMSALRTVDMYNGLLVLFPSWLLHYTDVNQSKNRKVLSFNTGYID